MNVYVTGKCFKTVKILKDQENRNPKGPKKYENVCTISLDDSALTELFMCSNCTRTYRLKHSLLRHMRLECGKEPKYTCSECNRKFKHKYDLNVHIRSKHVYIQNIAIPKKRTSI